MKTARCSNVLLSVLLGVGMVTNPVVVAGAPVVERKSVSFEAAMTVAQQTIAAGEQKKCPIVDGSGIPLVILRLDGGTEQFVEGAKAKAWTAVNLRDSTARLFESIEKGVGDSSQLAFVDKALLLMGGIPLEADGTIVGGIGVAGCPDGPDDEALARHGVGVFQKLITAK